MLGIVTPSYNQGQYLEEAIDSVLSQGYPKLQYVIIDGGSTDNSVDIIRKYEKYLTYWVSEKDRGQSHAINKGLARLKCDVWAYLNSDDMYCPGTFAKVMEAFADPSVNWVTGTGRYVDSDGASVKDMVPTSDWSMPDVMRKIIVDPIIVASQVANFFRSSVVDQYGNFDEALHYCMDSEFGLRFMHEGGRPAIIEGILAKARLHPSSKTVTMASSGAFHAETAAILRNLVARKILDAETSRAAKTALAEFRKLSAVAQARDARESKGTPSGISTLALKLITNPDLLAYRPALGLARQMLTGRRQ